MTFEKCVAYDHRLSSLEAAVKAHAKAHKNDANYCANEYWYSKNGPRAILQHLVGDDAYVQQLATKEAYDICYNHLYDILPDCTHDGMCRG